MSQAIRDAIKIERLGYSIRYLHFSSTGQEFGAMDWLKVSFYKNAEIAFSFENHGDAGEIYRHPLLRIKSPMEH